MKAREFKITKGEFKDRSAEILKIHSFLNDLPDNESQSVVIGNWKATKSDKQRRLNWMWNNEVSKSGKGSRDNPDDVHLDAKYTFALPLLLAGDDEYSAWIQDKFLALVNDRKKDGEIVRKFIKYDIETERMKPDMVAQFLKDYQNYWTAKGVRLTDPSLQGLDLIKDSVRQ